MTKINELILLLLLPAIDLCTHSLSSQTQTEVLNRKAKERMADTDSSSEIKRCAVVPGANKGIGLEICRQLASNGIMVVLTARDTERGLQAVESLKRSGLSDVVVFHQLDVMNSASIASLADFIKTQFGKLDILVNNAGIGGVIADADGLRALALGDGEIEKVNLHEVLKQTYELAIECLETNYYGVKGVTEALVPFLQLSDSARIVSVSASMGQLKNVSNEMAKEVLSNIDNLAEEKIDEVLNVFLQDFKEDLLEAKGWPTSLSAYTLSKAALNAYTRILAKKFPTFGINCVCPGFVKTDINCNTGVLSVEEGAKSPVTVALLPDDGPSGQFFSRTEVSNF